jgi:hypothetical protein
LQMSIIYQNAHPLVCPLERLVRRWTRKAEGRQNYLDENVAAKCARAKLVATWKLSESRHGLMVSLHRFGAEVQEDSLSERHLGGCRVLRHVAK